MQTTQTAPTVTSAPSSARDIAIVEDFFAAMEAQDLERALALMSDDVVYQNVPFPTDHGKEKVRRTLKSFERVFSSFKVQMKNIAARDGVVLTERVDVISGRFLHLDLWVCGTFEVKDGRITLWRDYFDLATATTKLVTSPIRRLFSRAS